MDDALDVFVDHSVGLMSGMLNALSVTSGVLSVDDALNGFVDDSVGLMSGMLNALSVISG